MYTEHNCTDSPCLICKPLAEWNEPEQYTITLNKYQRDNLLWLLVLVWGGEIPGTNTGDWCGEIPQLLDPNANPSELNEDVQPNTTIEQWREENK